MNLDNTRIGIIGLGYVGLPLAVEFGKRYPTVGFDLKAGRIEELRGGHDSTRETTPEALQSASQLSYTTDPGDLADCNVYIVTVPTPIDRYKRPDLTPLARASETVGRLLTSGDVVIYESTVYPGCTEEVCVPILERESGLRYAATQPNLVGAQPCHSSAQHQPERQTEAHGLVHAPTTTMHVVAPSSPGRPGAHPPTQPLTDHPPLTAGHFFVGYSPERINPGDQEHRLTTIRKVTSGSTPEAARFIDALYNRAPRKTSASPTLGKILTS